MVNTLISLVIIFCLLMMAISGSVFVGTEYDLQNFGGFIFFSLASFFLLYYDNKRSNRTGKYLTFKIIAGFIGGITFALSLAYVNNVFGKYWAFVFFIASSTALYELDKRFLKIFAKTEK